MTDAVNYSKQCSTLVQAVRDKDHYRKDLKQLVKKITFLLIMQITIPNIYFSKLIFYVNMNNFSREIIKLCVERHNFN